MTTYDDLLALLDCHSTPGDEDEVAAFLLRRWRAAGLCTTAHGTYAVSAAAPASGTDDVRPTLLICAHMDSPGYTVERIGKDSAKIIRLGHPSFEESEACGVLKTRTGRTLVTLRRTDPSDAEPEYHIPLVPGVERGDRVCFVAQPEMTSNGVIRSPFLDNRLGCFVLCALASRPDVFAGEFRVVLGATASEEMGGFGARVLAAAVRPDLVVCLDATYEAPEQGVLLGRGPVLTLSDASVLLSCRTRDRVCRFCADAGVPLQTEVYNYSGTDARAFPHQGLSAPVLPLLVATQGNHSPVETAVLDDVQETIRAVAAVSARGVSGGLLATGHEA
ncbi:MAG: hypothetical protein A3K19_06200 [Lentisphaerae bacterium RIFOXYB12_FULL_65_16]|nr:MAG: hypothetical protein A3K18_05150 [Lentisphaerae bacterium RIFOXYA12_64_32]OGV90222.1 MAG: hypothetical protein A3K19_06200 [Lentisphaerae bacterium RIFOXYB12_FULL_65_16]